MFAFSRLNKSRLANWWWTVDKVTLSLIFIIVFIGAFLVFTASPPVARTLIQKGHNVSEYHFINKQIFFIFFSMIGMVTLSMFRLKTIRRLAVLGYIGALILTFTTIFWGFETKGSSRWLTICGFPLQPSEFLKPTFVIVSAWLLDGSKKFEEFPGARLSLALFLMTVFPLALQPDVGTSIVVTAIWCFQLFLSGLPLVGICIIGVGLIIAAVIAYFSFGHVHTRVNDYIASWGSVDNLPYQVEKSLKAFENGNLLGKGPGEGVVKLSLPDAHTDFIFAVAGEEFGVWLCVFLVILFATIVIRSLWLSLKDNNLFRVYASAGLVASFGLQVIINMSTALYIFPTKGMALPFVSYGGSSMLASSLCMGMLLAITRKNSSAEDKDI